MEILNQYMNNWKRDHISFNLNTMYYYIYQSFVLVPPIVGSNEVMYVNPSKLKNKNEAQPFNEYQEDEVIDDRKFKIIQLKSKVYDLIDNMNKL